MMITLGQVAYEAAALASGCEQPWDTANQEKWEAAAQAVYNALATELPTAWRGPGSICCECGEYVPPGWMHVCS
jgi:hypothetical protein